MESKEDKNLQYRVYFEERNLLIKSKLDQSRQFDKAILTLAAGALGLSITFINQIAPNIKPGTEFILILAWIGFGISIFSILFSFLTSQKACEKQIEILEHVFFENEKNKKEKRENKAATWTEYLNILSIIFSLSAHSF
jgi:hypothetical protein